MPLWSHFHIRLPLILLRAINITQFHHPNWQSNLSRVHIKRTKLADQRFPSPIYLHILIVTPNTYCPT